MSDHKPMKNANNSEDMEQLFRLLERMGMLDELHRYRAAVDQTEDAAVEEPELIDTPAEPERREPVRFQPTEQTAVDARDLLLTDWEDPLKMSEYLVSGQEDVSLLEMFAEEEDEGTLPEPPSTRRNPFKALWLGFCGNLPRKEDSTGTKVRKCGFLTSLLVMLVAAVYLLVDLLVIPAKNEKLKDELIALYHPEKSQVVVTPEEVEKNHYPENMLASFTDLYDRNNEVRGWISYHATGKTDFLEVEYPIVYSGDNSKYLKKDFDGNKNRNGTLFFDQNNLVNGYDQRNRSLIVYGHNMASGQMFAGLNKMMGNVSNARAAATFTMSTLFREDQYKVFAVVLIDESDKNYRSYNMWRTEFNGDADFLNYIAGIRARSMFDYSEVTVEGDDQIVVLSTCTGKSSAHVKDGRLLVVARRVRDGEDPTVNASSIKKRSYDPDSDDSVIMPYYWYINQNKPVHKYYTENGMDTDPVQKPNSSTVATGYLPTVPSTTTRPGHSTTGTGTETTDTDSTGAESTDSTGIDSTGVTGSTTNRPTQSAPSGSSSTSGTSGTSGTTSATQTPETTKPTEPTTQPTEGGHTHTYDDCEDDTCNECGEKTREAGSCDFVQTGITEATCGEDGLLKKNCSVCGKPSNEAIPATGEHIYDADGVCTGCGAVKPTEPTEPAEPTE